MSILIRKGIPFTHKTTITDPDGCFIIINGYIGKDIITICTVPHFLMHLLCQEPVFQELQHCRQVSAVLTDSRIGKVRLQGRSACRVPGGTMKVVAATCSGHFAGETVLFEPPETGLPAGLLASPALTRVTRGTVYVPVINVGKTDVMLFWNTVLGTLYSVFIVSLPRGVSEFKSVLPPVQEQIKSLDLSMLTKTEQKQVRSLLLKFHTVFSAHEGDLGCTQLLSHDIPLTDSVPIRRLSTMW